jgi:hypothetical protein
VITDPAPPASQPGLPHSAPQPSPNVAHHADSSPKLRLAFLGGISLLTFAVHAVLSWPLAASLFGPEPPTTFFGRIEWAQGRFSNPRDFVIAYCLPLLVQTICALAALARVARGPVDRLVSGARWAFGWSVAFAVVSLGAADVLQRDSWLSVAWGRLIMRGLDPFTELYTPEDAAGLPLDDDGALFMTYGPLWALVSGGLAGASGGIGPLAWFLQKLLLLGFWIVVLVCVRSLARPLGPRREAMALVLTGWLPVGVHNVVAEQHNDGMMAALILLALVARRSWTGPLALAGSVLTKYTTAPLVPVALIYEWRTARKGLFMRIWPAGLVLAAGAAFVLSGERLNGTADMQYWHFLEPGDPLRLLGAPESIAIWSMRLLFGAVVVAAIVRLWRRPSIPELVATELAVMAFVLFTVVGHAWPWFFVWLLPLAALVPDRALSVFFLASSAVAPFTISFWTRVSEATLYQQIASSVMYLTGALALAVWLVRRSMKAARERTEHPAQESTLTFESRSP